MTLGFKRSFVKPVLFVSDLSSWGRVALSVGIPVIERYGIQVCPLPTALLSTHGGYPGAIFQPQTEFIARSLEHLETLAIQFSALFTGFIAELAQFDLLLPLADKIRICGGLVLVDPVMADNGKLYGFFTDDFVTKMRSLVHKADIITPNITEAALLLGKSAEEVPSTQKELQDWLLGLSELGPRMVAITSAPVHGREDFTGVALYDRKSNRFKILSHARIKTGYPGTGDLFASELLAQILKGYSFFSASRKTVAKIRRAVTHTQKQSLDPRVGLHKIL